MDASLSDLDGGVRAHMGQASLCLWRLGFLFKMGSGGATRTRVFGKDVVSRVFKDRDMEQTHLLPSPLIGPFSGPIPRGPAWLPIRAVPWLPSGPTGAPPLPLPRML